MNKELIILSLKRAAWTMLQVVLSMITLGVAIYDIDWINILSVAATAGVYSFIKSMIVGLPEAGNDGTLVIDDSDEEKVKWFFNLKSEPEDVYKKDYIRLKVRKDENS